MSTRSLLLELYKDIQGFSNLGDNANMRRILSKIEDTIRSQGGPEQELRDFPFSRRRCIPIEGPPPEPLSFADVALEFEEDDRRRSVFLDEKEAFIQAMLDFHTGRLKTVEFRSQSTEMLSGEPYEKELCKAARKRIPIVSVNSRFYSDAEVLSALRAMITDIETGKVSRHIKPSSCPRFLERCRLSATSVISAEWFDNGRQYEKVTQNEYECTAGDDCCSNAVYTKHGELQRTLWVDGDPNNPPPDLPPPYIPQSWTNPFPLVSGGPWKITSDFGWRTLNARKDFHGGLDLQVIAGVGGATVQAPRGGRVRVAVDGGFAGSEISIEFGRKVMKIRHTIPLVKVGDIVQQGEDIGYSAPSDVAHCHLEVFMIGAERPDIDALDPLAPGTMD